jgi:hypothetical protein
MVGLYSPPVADQSVRLHDRHLSARLSAAIDREGKIPHALGSLGPVAGRRVLLVDAEDGLRQRQLERLGARVSTVEHSALGSVPAASAEVVVACWSAIRPGEEPAAAQIGHVMRILEPAGRLLVIHDYGRDDVTALLGTPEREAQLVGWSHRQGPFLANGFKLRVLHCWWSWDLVEEAAEVLAAAFGAAGSQVAAGMRRPRLSYKVAVYHRDHEQAAGGRPALVAPEAAA